MSRVPAAWLLKPRSQASGIGMKKLYKPEELWPILEHLGDKQSHYLLEQFVAGAVFHVDSVVSERAVAFADAHAYGAPPLDVSHHGGVFTTRTLPRDSRDNVALLDANRKVIEGLGGVRGVTHAEFLKSHTDGEFYFLEAAARVGGAYISEVVEAASGVNLWREWARLEIGAGKQPYALPPIRKEYAGVICASRGRNIPIPVLTTTRKSSIASTSTITRVLSCVQESQSGSSIFWKVTPCASGRISWRLSRFPTGLPPEEKAKACPSVQ